MFSFLRKPHTACTPTSSAGGLPFLRVLPARAGGTFPRAAPPAPGRSRVPVVSVLAAGAEWEGPTAGLQPRLPENVAQGELGGHWAQRLPVPLYSLAHRGDHLVEPGLGGGRQGPCLRRVAGEVKEQRRAVLGHAGPRAGAHASAVAGPRSLRVELRSQVVHLPQPSTWRQTGRGQGRGDPWRADTRPTYRHGGVIIKLPCDRNRKGGESKVTGDIELSHCTCPCVHACTCVCVLACIHPPIPLYVPHPTPFPGEPRVPAAPYSVGRACTHAPSRASVRRADTARSSETGTRGPSAQQLLAARPAGCGHRSP